MEELTVNGYELFELIALLQGVKQGEDIKFKGFTNELGLTEGTKRYAQRILDELKKELDTLQKHRQSIYSETYPDLDTTESDSKKQVLDNELMLDKITIQINKIDFAKVSDLVLSENYQTLYAKVFKD